MGEPPENAEVWDVHMQQRQRKQQHKLQPQSKSGLRPAASKRSKGMIGNEEIQGMIKNFEQGLEVQRLRKALEMSVQSKQDSEQFIEASRDWFS